MEATMSDEAAAQEAQQVDHVIQTIADEHPHVRRELSRLNPPPKTSARFKLLNPPPSVRLTIATAGAAAAMPGIHHIHFFSASLDIRPEILRMVAELCRSEQYAGAYVFSRHRRAIQAGLGSALVNDEEWKEVGARLTVYSRSEALRHLQPRDDGRYLLVIDLDDLAKGIQFSDVYKLHRDRSAATILLVGHREHPLLIPYRRMAAEQPEWIQWGVSREQIKLLDSGPTGKSLDALWHLNPEGYDSLPARFSHIARERVIPPQLRKIPLHERRIWCTIAACYAVESARRRDAVRREVIVVDSEDDPALTDAAYRARTLSRRLYRGLVVSLELSRAIDDLAYYANLPRLLSIPVSAYVRHLGPSPISRLAKPVDRLVEIAEACLQSSGDRDDVRAEVRDIALTLEMFYADDAKVDAVPERTRRLTDLMNSTLDAEKGFTLLALNRAEAEAAESYFAARISETTGDGPSRSQRRKLLRVVEGRHISPEAEVGTVAIARVPTAEIVDKVAECPVETLAAVVERAQRSDAALRLHFDRYRESVILGPDRQQAAISRLISSTEKAVRLPPIAVALPPPESMIQVSNSKGRVEQDSDVWSASEDAEDESILESILESRDAPAGRNGFGEFNPDAPPRRVVLPSTHVVVEYEDGSREVLADDDVLLRVTDNNREPEAVRVDGVRAGDVLLTTNSGWGSTRLADIVVDLLTKHDSSLNVIDYLDRAWRSAITTNKESETWEDILERAASHGYDNVTSLSILFYAKRAVWLPKKKSNLAAVLKAVSPNEYGRPEMVEQIWTGTSRLKRLASRVLHYAKEAARNARTTWDDEMSDPVILEDLGLRRSHLDGLFELRRVKEVTVAAAGTELEL